MTAGAPGVLPVLLLADSPSLPRLAEILDSVPAGRHEPDSCRKLAARLTAGGSGSALLAASIGKLSLHAHSASPDERGRVAGVLPACGAVLLWAGGVGTLESLPEAGEWPGRLRPPGTAVLVAEAEETLQAGHDRLGGGWRITAHPPHSLLGILRLLHPGLVS